MAVLVSDLFNRADSPTIGNDSNGNAWVEVSGVWSIVRNAVSQTDTSTNPGELRCGTDMASTTHWIEARLSGSVGTGSIGLLCRMDATAFTGLSFEVADGAYKLIEVTNGTPSTVTPIGGAHTHAAGEVYAFEVSGTTCNFYLNGVLVHTNTSSHGSSNTRVGLHFNDDSTGSASGCRWDDVRAGNGAYPGPTYPVFRAAGAGALTATSSAALTPANPAGIVAGDLLVAHVFYGGSTAAPDTPSGWTLADGPRSLDTVATNGRTWVFTKKAVGGDADPAFGTQAVTTPRRARVYAFKNCRDDTVANMVGGFGFAGPASSATIADVSVTTPEVNCTAVQLLAITDDNTMSSAWASGSNGSWPDTPHVTAFTGTTGTPDTHMACYSAPLLAAGTIDGYSRTQSAADPWGITGFYIRGPAVATLTEAQPEAAAATGAANNAVAEVIWPAPILMAPMVAP